MRRLPPFAALRVFEVAAPETWLGQRLFVRVGRGRMATPAARTFAEEVSLCFERVTAAADASARRQRQRSCASARRRRWRCTG